MEFKAFFSMCQNEATVSDFESYLAHCIFQKRADPPQGFSVEEYSRLRDLAFERRDEKAAQTLFELARAADWQEGEWEGALR